MKVWQGHLVALLVMAIWGTTFVSSKVLLMHGMHPAEIFLLRFALAYAVMLAVCHRRIMSEGWSDELTFLGLGVFGGSLYFWCENTALVYSTSSNVSILVGSTPLLTALLVGAVYRSERLTMRQCLGSLIAFCGMALIVLNGQFILHLRPIGDMLALSAAATWAVYSLLMRWVSGRYSALFITRKVFFYGLLTIIPIQLLCHGAVQVSLLAEPVVLGNLLFLGLIASGACYLLWNRTLNVLGTVHATNYVYLQSLVTMLAAHMVLGERITWMAVLGVAVLIGGMLLVQRNHE